MSTPSQFRDAMDCLARIRSSTQSPQDNEHLWIAIQSLLFISSTGQRDAFADFLEYIESNRPPPVVASFRTREEADTWLNAQASPPDSTLVLIADQYYTVMNIRELNHRRLVSLPVMEYHLGRLKREGPPPTTASFKTCQEAEAWFSSQPEPPEQSLIIIGGNEYLAVYHQRVNHRALYPFSMALDEDPEESTPQDP